MFQQFIRKHFSSGHPYGDVLKSSWKHGDSHIIAWSSTVICILKKKIVQEAEKSLKKISQKAIVFHKNDINTSVAYKDIV